MIAAVANSLRGAGRLLRERGPRLLVELHGAEMARDVVGILHKLGYACAARVAPHIHPVGYGRGDPSMLFQVSGFYDIHFLVASRDPTDLPANWEEES